MLNFLLDIAPTKASYWANHQISRDIGKRNRVYYTYTSNPAFTPVL